MNKWNTSVSGLQIAEESLIILHLENQWFLSSEFELMEHPSRLRKVQSVRFLSEWRSDQ